MILVFFLGFDCGNFFYEPNTTKLVQIKLTNSKNCRLWNLQYVALKKLSFCLSLVWVFEGAHTFDFDFKVIYSLLGMKWSFFLILYFLPTFYVLFPIYFIVSFNGLSFNLFKSTNSFVHTYSLLTVDEYFDWTTFLVVPISFS